MGLRRAREPIARVMLGLSVATVAYTKGSMADASRNAKMIAAHFGMRCSFAKRSPAAQS